MIIEIALGIIVAVLILSFLSVIMTFPSIALGIAILLAGAGALIYFAIMELAATALVVGIVALIGGIAYWDAKHGYKKQEEARAAAAATALAPLDSPIPRTLKELRQREAAAAAAGLESPVARKLKEMKQRKEAASTIANDAAKTE